MPCQCGHRMHHHRIDVGRTCMKCGCMRYAETDPDVKEVITMLNQKRKGKPKVFGEKTICPSCKFVAFYKTIKCPVCEVVMA